MLIYEVIRQFADFKWEKRTQKSVKKDLIWSGYGINSQPNKKIPQDFLRRKELVFFREQGTCNRCGNVMDKIQKSSIILAQESDENGGYNEKKKEPFTSRLCFHISGCTFPAVYLQCFYYLCIHTSET